MRMDTRSYLPLALSSIAVAIGVLPSTSCETVLGADFDDFSVANTDGSPDDAGHRDAARGGAGGANTKEGGGASDGVGGRGDDGSSGRGGATSGGGAGLSDARGAAGTASDGAAGDVSTEDAGGPSDGATTDDVGLLDVSSDAPATNDVVSADASLDVSRDSIAADVDADADAPPVRDGSTGGASCMPNEVRSIGVCGNCGMFLQVCNAQGAWDPAYCRQETSACPPGSSERRPCAGGGTQVATCTAACTWSLGDCVAPPCTMGQSEVVPCSLCGTQRRSCVMTDGGLVWGPYATCAGQGACAAGTREVATCGRCGTRARLCSATCGWGLWSLCEREGECVAGATETRICTISPFISGKQTRRCSNACGWGPYDACR
jgi:hypothetical protein